MPVFKPKTSMFSPTVLLKHFFLLVSIVVKKFLSNGPVETHTIYVKEFIYHKTRFKAI